MAITDPHDPRAFRRYVSFNADGSVAAQHEFVANADVPFPAVEVTELTEVEFTALRLTPKLVAALATGDINAHAAAQLAIVEAAVDVKQAVKAVKADGG